MTKDISQTLKNSIVPIYKKLFQQNKFDNVCTFAVQWGEDFSREKNAGFLFVGKAVNGWLTNDQNIENLFDENNPDKIFNRNDQIQWVDNLSGNTTGYNTRKSAFWRLITKIASQYHGKMWYSHIAWTNLYKVAPYEGGNPNIKMQRQQNTICFELLENEIRILSPEYVIMLTSGWERPFFENKKKSSAITTIEEVQWKKYKTTLMEVDNVKYIVSHHPQGKNELLHKKAIIKLIDNDRIRNLPQVSIAKTHQKDIQKLSEWYEKASREDNDRIAFKFDIDTFYSLTINSEICGIMSVDKQRNRYNDMRRFVLLKDRHKGYADRMLNHLIEDAIQFNIIKIQGSLKSSNEKGAKYLISKGFKVIKSMKIDGIEYLSATLKVLPK